MALLPGARGGLLLAARPSPPLLPSRCWPHPRAPAPPKAAAPRGGAPAPALARLLPPRPPHLPCRGAVHPRPRPRPGPARASAAARSGADSDEGGRAEGGSEVLFVGTGTSEGVPRVSCLTAPDPTCRVCTDAILPGYMHEDGRMRHILIDAGKFFYHSAIEHFPPNNIRHIDAVVITHSHADAIGGLDDLRDWTNNVPESPHIPVYVNERDYHVMEKTHYYMMPKGKEKLVKGTAVSSIEFELMPPGDNPFEVEGLTITPLPVWHGHGYRSLGFKFGGVCYISDVSEIPEETFAMVEGCDLLIIDALRPDRSSVSHFGLPESLENVRRLRPGRVLFTGMMHTIDHGEVDEYLQGVAREEGIEMGLSWDGMRVPVQL